MSGLTVNISDFHCRGMKARNSRSAARSLDRPYGLFVIEEDRTYTEPNRSGRVAKAEPCEIFDISLAREAQRARKRYTFRPIGAARKAQVLRFGAANAKPDPKVLQQAAAVMAPMEFGGPTDLPPAA